MQPIKETVKIMEGTEIAVDKGIVTAKGPKGSVVKNMFNKEISIRKEGGDVVFETKRDRKREKRVLYSFIAHLKNMMKGAKDGYIYKLKVCAAHFPITVNIAGNEVQIKNFLGETIPRTTKIKNGATVKVDGEFVIVTGADLEIVSQTAADIEQLTRISNRDRRRFQDGIYIIEKDNEPA